MMGVFFSNESFGGFPLMFNEHEPGGRAFARRHAAGMKGIRGNPQKNVLNLVLRWEILRNYESSLAVEIRRSLQEVACIACIGGFPHGQVLYSIKPVACSSLATSGCSVDSLLVVNIPETVQRIENEAFTSCHFLVPLREFVFIAFFGFDSGLVLKNLTSGKLT